MLNLIPSVTILAPIETPKPIQAPAAVPIGPPQKVPTNAPALVPAKALTAVVPTPIAA
ncbi:hypothetical protein Q8G37_22390 [Bacillus wiedmannii]|uniref:hypothetical protein n=1 Tax=Bacillus wiedmannii TaxID=1890302 RepID=UPI00272F3250|nr:hypothetical protein [Bacillus wiedmannii]MDP1459175.1 hypothetical protein [Bacillus wiedmannii]